MTPCGNTGEFYTLTPDERRPSPSSPSRRPPGRAAVLVGVGHDVPTATDSARHARDAGADMVMVHQPVHPYVSRDGWIDYHREIAGAVPGLGVVPYIRNPLLDGARPSPGSASCAPTSSASSTRSPTPPGSPPWRGTPA